MLRFIGLLLAIEHAVDKARQGGLVLRLLGQFLLFVVIDVARLLTQSQRSAIMIAVSALNDGDSVPRDQRPIELFSH